MIIHIQQVIGGGAVCQQGLRPLDSFTYDFHAATCLTCLDAKVCEVSGRLQSAIAVTLQEKLVLERLHSTLKGLREAHTPKGMR